eukprot:2469-Alexandrium_andersonii.AAC.1
MSSRDSSSSSRSIDAWGSLVNFRPMLVSEHPGAEDIIRLLPTELQARQAERLGSDPATVVSYLAIELPPTTICRDYAEFQNHFVDTSWMDLSLEDYRTPITVIITDIDGWSGEAILQCSQSIFDH